MSRPKGFSDATVTVIRERDRDLCAWCGLPVFGERGYSWSVHHRRPRASGGTRLAWVNEPANGVLLHGSGTTQCHGAVESNRTRALAQGFLILSNGRGTAVDIPIRHAVHGTVHLRNVGDPQPISDPLFKELMSVFGQIRAGVN